MQDIVRQKEEILTRTHLTEEEKNEEVIRLISSYFGLLLYLEFF